MYVCLCVCQYAQKAATAWSACSSVAVRTPGRVVPLMERVLAELAGPGRSVNYVRIYLTPTRPLCTRRRRRDVIVIVIIDVMLCVVF